ncbi:MAG: NAD(P)-dependent glycerol-3-phosphate dehydrogenase [Candidatus Kapabacteria bacterium]|nr:NAD(P)-dependent glycerol-3-phosphate dehydrogenase [Candidatus Kapabacteria bacterium]MDW8012653.1 NAD(P)H-dependent glycerol-3-phosphate dehydrogenase [Bacteroidota bacterium]
MRIVVLGAGSWGTVLGSYLAQRGYAVTLWARSAEVAQSIAQEHRNPRFLPGIRLPDTLSATTDPWVTLTADLVVLAIPTQYIRATLQQYGFPISAPVVNVAKGIEQGTLLRISELLQEVAGIPAERYAVLSGPSHAEEVVHNLPTAVVVASQNRQLAQWVQQIFTSPRLRVYTSHDVVGVELGGALKNIIAVAAGIVDGLELGDNAKAALLTRGLAEIQRLGTALGAEPRTFAGLSGIGDLVATCNSRHSRNRAVGQRLALGEPLQQILASTPMVAEGIPTTLAAYQLSLRTGVEMPITAQMYAVLFQGKPPRQAVEDLLTREVKAEYWWN